MKSENLTSSKLIAKIETNNFKGKIISISHLSQIEEKIKSLVKNKNLDKTFYDECLSIFNFEASDYVNKPKSIIIIAIAQPTIEVSFMWKSKEYFLIIPPTYLHEPDDEAKNFLEATLACEGYKFKRAVLPLKTIAVHSGLAQYGRNNITYIKGMGSFFRLVGFVSDFPCEDSNWTEPKMVSTCKKCTACLKNCPTQAIIEDRFLINAHNCLTFHNERVIAFPEWLDADIHHCIVGCMKCQIVCPENKEVLKWKELKEFFTEEETHSLLNKKPNSELPNNILEKLERLSLTEYIEILPRNLKAVLNIN